MVKKVGLGFRVLNKVDDSGHINKYTIAESHWANNELVEKLYLDRGLWNVGVNSKL